MPSAPQTRAELDVELNALRQGLRSEYHQLLDGELARWERLFLVGLSESDNPHKIMKLVGGLDMVRSLRAWPNKRAELLQRQIEQLKEKP